MVYLVYFLILATLLPFGFTTSEDNLIQTLVARVPKELGFFAGASLIIAMSMWNQEKVNTFNNKWIAAFLVWVVCHFFFLFYLPIININTQGMYIFKTTVVRPFLNMFLGVVLIKVLVESLSHKDWIKICKFLCWTGFLLSVYSILQWFGIDQIFQSENWKLNHSNGVVMRKDFMMTFMSHHVLSSNYIALIAPLCLMFQDFRYKLFFAVMAVSVCMADSLTSFAALGVSVIAYLILCVKWRKLFLVIILMSVLAVFLGGKHQNFFGTNSRESLWKDSISDVAKNAPYTGLGIGSYPKKYKVGKEMALSAHNEFVQVANEGGLIMVVIVIGYLITLFRRTILLIIAQRFIMTICFFSAVLGLLVISNGSFPFRFAPLATLGILYIAYMESQLSRRTV